MKITQLKINGIENPLGFEMKSIQCSWKVEQAEGKRQDKVRICVALDKAMSKPVYEKSGKNLCSRGEMLELTLMPKTRYFYTVEVVSDCGETAISDTAWFETSKMEEGWNAKWISTQKEDTFHPEFIKTFSLDKKIKSARVYVSGVGLYELYINSKKAGDEFLAPFTGDYSQTIQYQTYDVTGMLAEENKISVYCGNGWYKGRLGYEGHQAVFGNSFAAIAELEIIFEDDTKQIIVTDESWQYKASDIVYSDIYDGEKIDRLKNENILKTKDVCISDVLSADILKARSSLYLIAREDMPVKEIIRTPVGEMVLDFGQNFAGYVEFSSEKIKKGSKVILDFGEILQNGNFYNDNYRTAKSQFVYTAGEEKEQVRPHFTFYGFRYVRVTGWEDLEKSDFIGKAVYSNLPITGELTTSDERINRLFQNCLWGQKSNFVDIPMDCPQRDERLGWTGDAQVFAPTASFNMYTKQFYQKYLDDIHSEQKKWNGAVPNYIPNYTNTPGGAAIWGDAATFIPMTLYEYYGDKVQLRHNFPMMKEWVDYLTLESQKNRSHYLINFGMQFGDWLAMDGITEQSFKGGTDEYYLSSVYYYASVRLVADAAEILGEIDLNKKYDSLAGNILQAILDEYFTSTGRLAIDTQAAYVVSLRFKVYRYKDRVMEGFKERLRKDCYRIKCGFAGAPVLCKVLAENDMLNLAYRILFYEGFPGWLRQVKLGATTIWERWNSVLDDGMISGTNMNSLNHYSYGSVIEFLYRQTAGIEPLEAGFGRVRFAPKPDYRIRELKCSYDSVSGKYSIHWKLLPKGKVWICAEVPFNCSASLYLPGSDEVVEICAGTYETEYQPKVNFLNAFNDDSILDEIKINSEAADIIKELLPVAYGMMQENDKESMSLSFNDMMKMPYMGFSPDMVAEAARRIKDIEV